ncbi:4-amino-4-deoxy-L-arabinose-phosphoundecaprenol flippase subunit ArnE [Pseudomonas sp. Marseille-QA0892]
MTIMLVALASFLSCLGQIAQKIAVERWRGHHRTAWQKLRSPWLLAGLTFLGLGLLAWLLVLQRLEVGIAYPMLSLNFVWVTLAAHWLFHEHIDARHWLGVGLIIAGIVVLGMEI